MPVHVTVLALLAILGVTLLLLLPFHMAAFIAWRTRPELPHKRLFVLTCALLAYGGSALVFVAFVPIQLIAINLSPQWQAAGNSLPQHIFGPAASATDIVVLIVGLALSVLVPLRLRGLWPAVAAAWR